MVLDGSARVDKIIESALAWDVMGGVARRAWAGNAHSIETSALYNERTQGKITLPYLADPGLIQSVMAAQKRS